MGIHELPFETPPDLVCQVTALFHPSMLRDPQSTLVPRLKVAIIWSFTELRQLWLIMLVGMSSVAQHNAVGVGIFVKWGIEITRDGNRLDGSRNPRLENYAQWLEEGDMSQYILVDYRVTRPVHSHPDIRHLHHVVFANKYDEYFNLQGGDLSVICDQRCKASAQSDLPLYQKRFHLVLKKAPAVGSIVRQEFPRLCNPVATGHHREVNQPGLQRGVRSPKGKRSDRQDSTVWARGLEEFEAPAEKPDHSAPEHTWALFLLSTFA
ncbi:hypothetical protein ARMGADRAFT_1033648 [Armillaria gallica]|uniref:Uncharacterized protein n=1 Tax=Armillaria gallica TaxID=47427 RepID=A0A2H3DJ19_ARMGA|nr:hypothetical protein ARMGADRAFT_1033648 [Armillaria gallica]